MQPMMKHRSIFKALLLATAFVALGLGTASAQQPMMTRQDMNADKELAFNLRKHFRYRHNLYEVDSVVTDYFFSLRMEIDPNGLLTDVRHSVGMDTALFGKSYRDFVNNVPRDIFRPYGLSNIGIIVPMLIILRPNEKDRFDFKRNAAAISQIWEFEDDGAPSASNTLLYRPLLIQHFYHGEGLKENWTPDPKDFVHPEHKKSLERNRTKLDKFK